MIKSDIYWLAVSRVTQLIQVEAEAVASLARMADEAQEVTAAGGAAKGGGGRQYINMLYQVWQG